MADTGTQARTMGYADSVLREHFRDADRQAYVATDTILYYWEGRNDVYVAPDVMVVLGLPDRARQSYRLWEKGNKSPDFVIEVQAVASHAKAEKDKRELYLWMGVREYFRYDPEGDTMVPKEQGRRLIGLRLENGRWREMPEQGDGSIRSAVLELDLRLKRQQRYPPWRELRFRDPATGRDLLSYGEIHAWLRKRRAEKDRERAAKQREQLRANEAKRTLEQLARATQRETRARQRETRARQRAERRIAELEARLREARGQAEGA